MSRIWNNLEEIWRFTNNVETEDAKTAAFLLCPFTLRGFTCIDSPLTQSAEAGGVGLKKTECFPGSEEQSGLVVRAQASRPPWILDMVELLINSSENKVLKTK